MYWSIMHPESNTTRRTGDKIEEASNTYWNRLIANNKTSLQRISNKDIRRNKLNETA